MNMLRGSVTEMSDELLRRRDAFGVSYVSVNGAFLEQLAPVVERLAGRWPNTPRVATRHSCQARPHRCDERTTPQVSGRSVGLIGRCRTVRPVR